MVCQPNCPLENAQTDPDSPGPVANAEVVCRGGFGKNSHYKNKLEPKHDLIRFRDFINGELSVWRLNDPQIELDEIVEILAQNPPPKNSLWDVFGATAEAVRNIRAPSRPDEQAIHVIDDSRIDSEGNKHPKHATIGICAGFEPLGFQKDTLLYLEIRDELFKCFKQNIVWALPVQQRV